MKGNLNKSNEKVKVLSFFSGAGGLDMGFINAGCEIIWANDFFKSAVDTYKKNIGDHIVHGDITKIKSSEIPDNPDIIIGGFPCQGFSIANSNRSMEDKRNFLYKELVRVVKDKNPLFFVVENVKGLLSMEDGKVIKLIISDFEALGYKVDYKVVNTAEYGVPQKRERVIIIGNRVGAVNPFPTPTHYLDKKIDGLLPAITVEDCIGSLADVAIGDNVKTLDNGKTIYNHVAQTNVSPTFIQRKHLLNQEEICDYLRFWRAEKNISITAIDTYCGYKNTAAHWFRKDNKSGSIPKPADWIKLKELLDFDSKYDEQVLVLEEKEIKFEQSLRVTNWDRPSDTITATGPEIHINGKRRLSVRECAIIQSFPDDFIFEGSLSNMYKQVGNAVPPKMSVQIAKVVIEELKKYKSKGVEVVDVAV